MLGGVCDIPWKKFEGGWSLLQVKWRSLWLSLNQELVKGGLGLAHVFGPMVFGGQWYFSMVFNVRMYL